MYHLPLIRLALWPCLFFLLNTIPLNAQSKIGHWGTDEKQLPVFHYTGSIPYAHKTALGQKIDLPEDPWFLLGNYRLSSFVYTSGAYELYGFERAWGKLNDLKATNAFVIINKRRYPITGLESTYARNSKKEFGTGFARFTYELPEHVQIIRTLSVPPSEKPNTGLSGIFITVEIKNLGDRPAKIEYSEQTGAHYNQIGQLPWLRYLARQEPEPAHAGLSIVKFTARSSYARFPKPEEISLQDAYPPALYLYSRDTCTKQYSQIDSTAANTSLTFKRNVQAHSAKRIQLVSGWASDSTLKKELSKVDTEFSVLERDPGFRNKWVGVLPHFETEKDSILGREMIWNAYNLEAMAKYNSYFDETFIPQGMNYDFKWGLTAATRDLMFFSMPVAYYNPRLAKSIIRTVSKMMRESGSFDYTLRGFGFMDSNAMTPSDFQLDYFWMIANYLEVTGDYSILTETSTYYPRGSGSGNLIEKLQKAFNFLRDDVNVGPHGLIRVLNADWNDQVWANYSMGKYIWGAESHYNSALALSSMAALDQALSVASKKVKGDELQKVNDLKTDIELFRLKQLKAFMKDLGKRIFPRRVYYSDSLMWGNNSMHAESVAMTLLVPELETNRKIKLVDASWKRLVNGEVLGPRLSDLPIEEKVFAKGTRENAGVWFFTSGLLALGYAQVDQTKAWQLLHMMSFQNFSNQYPEYWAGQWTNLDCTNSSLANYPGLPDNPKGMWNAFPAYCSNAHAFPLLVYLKLRAAGKKN